MKIEYDNLKDAQSKLLGTYCMYDGEAIVVKNVYNDNGADDKFVLDGYKMSTQRGVGLISLNDNKFNCADFNIGYMNKLSHAGWWYRLPVKQYYQGLRHSQCSVKTSSPTEYPLEMKASKALANMLENTYPKLDIAVEMLKSGEANIAAFHRNFAITFDRIHSDFILEYKGDLIGHFKKLGEFALMPQFDHLKEALQEAVG